jgi:hypothetical protein
MWCIPPVPSLAATFEYQALLNWAVPETSWLLIPLFQMLWLASVERTVGGWSSRLVKAQKELPKWLSLRA